MMVKAQTDDIDFVGKTLPFLNNLSNDELKLLRPMITALMDARRKNEVKRIEKMREAVQRWLDKGGEKGES